ncbi:uncharacterized protein LOC141641782 [Silene latifolia]|uniref:uncharacterized protein LOC141641782 n=1 Tax=Silene latifolia TaxID=37657 RepID=UPI003D7706ED
MGGSMRGQKIALLKKAVNFVIKNLGPLDRLSIITFSTSSHRLTPLKRMTQAGQAETLRAVDSIQADGSTNIIAGLKSARKVLALRREMNPDSSIILLSDGHDTENPFIMSSLIQNALSNSLTARAPRYQIPVYTFGFGSDHDDIALHAISDGSGGSFSYIEAVEVIQDAFAQCLGGLLNVVAKEVEIQVHSVCPEVDREKNRILTAQGIAEAKKMAEREELDGARTMLEMKRRSVGQSDAEEVEDGATMSLFGQAGMVAQCKSSSHTYVGGGRTLAFSAQSSHQNQRAAAQILLPAGHSTVFGAALTSGAPGGNESGFQTSFIQQMVTKSQQERQASDQNQGTDH